MNYSKDCFICRRSIDKSEMLDNDNNLEIFAIQAERLFDYSTNLVNSKGVSNVVKTFPDDVLIIPEKEFIKYSMIPWNNTDKDVPKNVKSKKNEEFGFFLLKIADFDNIISTFPFPKKRNKPKIFTQINFKTVITYCPNMINVLHFEINCESDFNGGVMQRVKAASIKPDTYREAIIHMIRNKIIREKKYYLDLPEQG